MCFKKEHSSVDWKGELSGGTFPERHRRRKKLITGQPQKNWEKAGIIPKDWTSLKKKKVATKSCIRFRSGPLQKD